MLHILKVLLLPPAHRAEVKGAAAVEARQGGQVCAIQGILCVQTHGGEEEAEADQSSFREVQTKLQGEFSSDKCCCVVT